MVWLRFFYVLEWKLCHVEDLSRKIFCWCKRFFVFTILFIFLHSFRLFVRGLSSLIFCILLYIYFRLLTFFVFVYKESNWISWLLWLITLMKFYPENNNSRVLILVLFFFCFSFSFPFLFFSSSFSGWHHSSFSCFASLVQIKHW